MTTDANPHYHGLEDLTYHGRPMAFAPVNVPVLHLIQMLHVGSPQVVSLEPGDATRYTLLLLPLTLGEIGAHLDAIGIPTSEADRYLFVSKLSCDECPGTWIPYGPDVTVSAHHVTELSTNEWSRELLSWWFTGLYRLLF